MRVNEKDFHAGAAASNHSRRAASSRFWRAIPVSAM